MFTFTRLEESLTNNIFNQSIDVIYDTLVERNITPFISVCYRSTFIQTNILRSIGEVEECEDVTVIHLEEITGTFDLSNMLIFSFKRVDLLNLTNIILLDLTRNMITMLPAGIFDDLTMLTRLDLYSNMITMLPSGIFDELTMLSRLDFARNVITTLPAGIFDELTMLIRLDFTSNMIITLPIGIFTELMVLNLLFMQTNGLNCTNSNYTLWGIRSGLDRASVRFSCS